MKQLLFVLLLLSWCVLASAQFTVGASGGYSVKAHIGTAGLSVGYKYDVFTLESGMLVHVPFRSGAFFQQKAGVQAGNFNLYTGGSYHFFSSEDSKDQPENGWHLITGLKYKHPLIYQECYSCPPQKAGYWGFELSQDGRYTFISALLGVYF